ncbi:NUMOD4 motif-containing HNH endonuclease [Sphingomonas melonis]|uniref:NUMOD4 motif-containing HNH endonuclease n=1 Tax=Sphingomonas melonis TaxID=152682 RepID=UPI0035C85A90
MSDTHKEEWKPVAGFDGYEVSNLGRVRSYRSLNGRGPLKSEPHILKPSKFAGKKYLRYGLQAPGGMVSKRAHHLVLETFVGPRPPGCDGLHADDDQTNNALSNLRWGTHADNVEDKIRNGKQIKGSEVHRAVIDEVAAARIKAKLANDNSRGSVARIAREENVSRTVVSSIKFNKTWKHVCP